MCPGPAVLDGSCGGVLAAIALPGHPESFLPQTGGPLIFVNIPTASHIVAVVNRGQRRIVATSKLGGARGNFPMALDKAGHRPLVVCRAPAELLVLKTDAGRIVARVPSVARDGIGYDAPLLRAYITGGAGSITLIERQDANHYLGLTEVPAPPGGRTSLLVPALGRLYLGAWGRAGNPDELRSYEVLP